MTGEVRGRRGSRGAGIIGDRSHEQTGIDDPRETAVGVVHEGGDEAEPVVDGGRSKPRDRQGRWDPLGFDSGDTNLYRYVHNAPTTNSDPTGERYTPFEASFPWLRESLIRWHWAWDDKLVMDVPVHMVFDGAWKSPKEMMDFRSKFRDVVEQWFNNNPYRLYSSVQSRKRENPCGPLFKPFIYTTPYPLGVKPQLTITYSSDVWWQVWVQAIHGRSDPSHQRPNQFQVSHDSAYLNLYQDSVQGRRAPAVRLFAQVLGLEPTESPSDELMGGGEGYREYYFAPWGWRLDQISPGWGPWVAKKSNYS